MHWLKCTNKQVSIFFPGFWLPSHALWTRSEEAAPGLFLVCCVHSLVIQATVPEAMLIFYALCGPDKSKKWKSWWDMRHSWRGEKHELQKILRLSLSLSLFVSILLSYSLTQIQDAYLSTDVLSWKSQTLNCLICLQSSAFWCQGSFNHPLW